MKPARWQKPTRKSAVDQLFEDLDFQNAIKADVRARAAAEERRQKALETQRESERQRQRLASFSKEFGRVPALGVTKGHQQQHEAEESSSEEEDYLPARETERPQTREKSRNGVWQLHQQVVKLSEEEIYDDIRPNKPRPHPLQTEAEFDLVQPNELESWPEQPSLASFPRPHRNLGRAPDPLPHKSRSMPPASAAAAADLKGA